MKQLLNTLFVTSEDAYLSLENDNVVVQRDKTALAKIPLRSLEQILSFSYKGASPALMGQCAQTGTGLSFYTPRGRYLCSILGENNRNVLLRRSQYRFADDTDSSARFARSFVIGKIFNSRWVLERTKRDHNLRVNVKRLSGQSQALSGYLKQVSGCNDVDAIRGLEGFSAGDFEQRENGGVFLNDAGRKTVLAAWQKRKQEVITHPFLGEKMPWGLIPYVQALLLARAIRGDIDAYPPFMWK